MKPKDCRPVTEVLEEAIASEHKFYDVICHCADETGDPMAKAYLMKLAHHEEVQQHDLEEYLLEIKAQQEIDEAIRESYSY